MSDLDSPDLILAWWSLFRNQRLAVRDVVLVAIEGGPRAAGLRAALMSVAPSIYPGQYSPHKLGRWLARHGGRPLIAGPGEVYRLVDHGAADGNRTWQLVSESYARERAAAEAALPEGILDAVVG